MTTADDALVEVLQTFDRRLSAIDQRFVQVEHHLAEAAQAGEETGRQLDKLRELYVSIDRRLEEMNSMLANYVEATKGLRRETSSLHSEVREKLKASGG